MLASDVRHYRGFLEPLQAIVPICCSTPIDEKELKGVRPKYEITARACSQLSALHRNCSGTDHSHHDHPGIGLNDFFNHQDHQEEGEDGCRRNHFLDLNIDEHDGSEGHHHFHVQHFEDHHAASASQDSNHACSGSCPCASRKDGHDDRSGSQDRGAQGSGCSSSGFSSHCGREVLRPGLGKQEHQGLPQVRRQGIRHHEEWRIYDRGRSDGGRLQAGQELVQHSKSKQTEWPPTQIMGWRPLFFRSGLSGSKLLRQESCSPRLNRRWLAQDALPSPTSVTATMITSMPAQSSRTGRLPTPDHSPSARPTIPPKRT